MLKWIWTQNRGRKLGKHTYFNETSWVATEQRLMMPASRCFPKQNWHTDRRSEIYDRGPSIFPHGFSIFQVFQFVWLSRAEFLAQFGFCAGVFRFSFKRCLPINHFTLWQSFRADKNIRKCVLGQDELRFKQQHGKCNKLWATKCLLAESWAAGSASWGINFKALGPTLAVANNSS